jgi:hypothetical protein
MYVYDGPGNINVRSIYIVGFLSRYLDYVRVVRTSPLSETLQDICFSPNIIRVVKRRGTGGAEHVARVRGKFVANSEGRKEIT